MHLYEVQQVVFFKLRKSPFLKQLLKLVVFLSLVYLLILRSFCSCSLQLGAKLGWKPIATAAWVMLGQNCCFLKPISPPAPQQPLWSPGDEPHAAETCWLMTALGV